MPSTSTTMPTLNSLPSTILADIFSYLPIRDAHDNTFPARQARLEKDLPELSPSYLPAYATVCRVWQSHIERRTFENLDLESTQLAAFSRLVTGERREALRWLRFIVVLPEYGPAEYEVAESEEDQVRNNEVLNAAIAGLFGVLKGWESDDAVGGCGKSRLRRLELTLFQMYSPGDAKRHRWVVKQLHEARMFLANITIRERLPGSTLGVLRVDELPELGIIRKFVASPMYQRRVDAASIARLAGKFSALEEVDLDVDADWDLEEMRGRRYEFALALLPLAALPLKVFRLRMNYPTPDYQFKEPPSMLLASSPDIDHLSLALQAISRAPSMKVVEILGPISISPQLFWPPTSLPPSSEFAFLSASAPLWPSLTSYYLGFSMLPPSGSWYFIRHPNNPVPLDFAPPPEPDPDSDDYVYFEPFRTYPDDTAVNDLLAAAGRARLCMPSLRSLYLYADMKDRPRGQFYVSWDKGGVKSYMDYRLDLLPIPGGKEDFLRRDHVCWLTGEGGDWRPSTEVQELWVGDGVQQYFTDPT